MPTYERCSNHWIVTRFTIWVYGMPYVHQTYQLIHDYNCLTSIRFRLLGKNFKLMQYDNVWLLYKSTATLLFLSIADTISPNYEQHTQGDYFKALTVSVRNSSSSHWFQIIPLNLSLIFRRNIYFELYVEFYEFSMFCDQGFCMHISHPIN